ncbi:putative transcriptional regulator [Sphingomonas sp. BE138]|uniref:MucR family transcriptional regulator n=1 Tax=Sphingomonas sp. BE138 TaxID=2817845 RepID=UPI00285AD7D3|nr:MucR family transcriptional regulator [Sphingomonas sp. BE138]MDR6790377.1 putative transcriptional regulator [Sphingomonas sp. BE138]
MTTEINATELATELTIAWLGNSNTRVSADDVPAFLQSMYATVTGLGTPADDTLSEPTEPEYTPAVSVRKSLASKDHIISMIDGKPYKTLRRHLSGHGLTPDEYRSRYGLKADYPMVAETYSESRRAMAKRIGLGRKAKATSDNPASADTAGVSTPKGRRGARKAEASDA